MDPINSPLLPSSKADEGLLSPGLTSTTASSAGIRVQRYGRQVSGLVSAMGMKIYHSFRDREEFSILLLLQLTWEL
ncbi:hypothetical protein Ocin01_13720 [Orchesella cincta]|uniref:Uncharacterized protein n=1 Tax=Orchesella cincta TaxID=48709 RepID=A0A1D2MJ81_ORCCI|nr:hypothetical protein Ocin01_13720 [Orchesella cincta]